MKLLIAGSRTLDVGDDAIHKALGVLGIPVDTVTEVVHGGARGVDIAGREWARRRGLPHVGIVPDWKKHGIKAGILRNTDLVDYCDAALVFWDGKSKGTMDTVGKLQDSGKPYTVSLILAVDK